jgi:chromosome partitioning protein
MQPRFNVVIFADKGGVGKTTTTVNLAVFLSMRGYRVLIVDMDTRGDCATSLGIPPAPGVFQWFGDDPDFPTVQRDQVIKPTRFERLEILPGNRRTETLNAIYNQEGVQLYTVARRLEALTEGYDFVLFDSTPASGLLRDAAFQCAHVVIIPAKPEYLGFGEIGPVLERLNTHQRAVVLPTMYDARESVQQGVLISIQQRWPKSIIRNGNELPLCIPDRTDVRQASFARQTLMEYAPKSEATRAYATLADNIVNMTMGGKLVAHG